MKFCISINITVCGENKERKSYRAEHTYEGDPKKLDITAYIDGWFIENNIDKSMLDSFDTYVYKQHKDDMLMEGVW